MKETVRKLNHWTETSSWDGIATVIDTVNEIIDYIQPVHLTATEAQVIQREREHELTQAYEKWRKDATPPTPTVQPVTSNVEEIYRELYHRYYHLFTCEELVEKYKDRKGSEIQLESQERDSNSAKKRVIDLLEAHIPQQKKWFTRVEVIDGTGRKYVNMDCKAFYDIQDKGKTLKVFVNRWSEE